MISKRFDSEFFCSKWKNREGAILNVTIRLQEQLCRGTSLICKQAVSSPARVLRGLPLMQFWRLPVRKRMQTHKYKFKNEHKYLHRMRNKIINYNFFLVPKHIF